MSDYETDPIRAALAAALSSLVDDGTLSVSSPYLLSSPPLPCAMVGAGPIDYHGAMGGGLARLVFDVSIVFPLNSVVDAQRSLDELRAAAGPRSVKRLLEADGRLDGACQDVQVTGVSRQEPYALDSPGGAQSPPNLGCTWTVSVIE